MKKDTTSNPQSEEQIYTQNRELSWLRFNQRVLEEAQDINVPLYERLKFVSIFESNLDEFFMIRVGSLTDLALLKKLSIDNKTGWSAERQLEEVFTAVRPLYLQRDQTFDEIEKALRAFGVLRVSPAEMIGNDKKNLEKQFYKFILPVLSPQIIDLHHPFPHLANNVLHILLVLHADGKKSLGIIPLTQALPSMLSIEGEGVRYALTEEVLISFADKVFERFSITASAVIKVTRNADISPEDENYDMEDGYRQHMKKVLKKRARLASVRLEIQGSLPADTVNELCTRLRIRHHQVFHSRAPLKMGYVFGLGDKLPSGFRIAYPPFVPQYGRMVQARQPVLPQVLQHDVLLHYPYESMDVLLHLVREASADPDVVSIKITIYRLATTSKLVTYLTEAAENGKDVTALMELRARFDEQNNIDWAERLEDAGCTVTYGIENYKVHSKVCLITRRAGNEIQYITQFGTGNYNEKTAKLYTDFCLITADPDIGEDAATFFQNMSIGNLRGEYRQLLVAPVCLKSGVLEQIDREIAKQDAGDTGLIRLKLNSLTDREILTKLSQASCAGVRVELIVRGVCCLLPGVAQKTENIEIHSIVGRFLEHTRFYSFGAGDDLRIYIASADLMTRNTEKRVEVACPVRDPAICARIMRIWDTQWHDNINGRIMNADGTYRMLSGAQYTAVNCQQNFIDEALKSAPVLPQTSAMLPASDSLPAPDSLAAPDVTEVPAVSLAVPQRAHTGFLGALRSLFSFSGKE